MNNQKDVREIQRLQMLRLLRVLKPREIGMPYKSRDLEMIESRLGGFAK